MKKLIKKGQEGCAFKQIWNLNKVKLKFLTTNLTLKCFTHEKRLQQNKKSENLKKIYQEVNVLKKTQIKELDQMI